MYDLAQGLHAGTGLAYGSVAAAQQAERAKARQRIDNSCFRVVGLCAKIGFVREQEMNFTDFAAAKLTIVGS